MLLVMPVCAVDLELARNVADWICTLGGAQNHRALLVWAPEVQQSDKDYILERFNKSFARVNQMSPRIPDSVSGWPDAPNLTFEYVVHYCCVVDPKYSEGGPWFFFEADQTPMRPGWLNAIEEEYYKLGKPCMGVLEQSWKVPPGGQKVPAGHHLVGTAVYPPYFHTLTDSYKNCRRIAFDVKMQKDLVDRGRCAHTNLMLHCWLTENFRRIEDGSIVCDKREGRLPGQIGYSLDRVVKPTDDFAVVHGCKDGSLLRLLQKEWAGAKKYSPTPTIPKTPKTPSKPTRRRARRKKAST